MKRLAGWIGAGLLAAGAVGLIGAMIADGLAVVGRHAGMPLHGSIEVVQAFITIGAASSIAYASLGGAHAAVDLLYQRFPKWMQDLAHRLAALLGFVFVAGLIAGSGWIAWEYWGAGEKTELLGIPIRWFRLFWLACSAIAAVALVAPLFAKSPADSSGGSH